MDITQVSIIQHVGIVLLVLWLLAEFNWCHPLAYFLSLIYLFLVHERYIIRLRKKLQFEETKQANQRRVLSDSETVRWLNHAVEKIWPICMEQIASQKILLPIVPWFLEKYKPWTAKKAIVQHLYLGRNPPIFTDMRILRQSNDDDHLVMELGMNFLTADDMSAILAVKLRKRLGFGMWAKLHITGMHIEGKVLIGVKFRRDWPYLSRLRLCFVEPPYFQMTVKPIFTHGLDVTELPGIAGWLDKLLSIAFEQTLVESISLENFLNLNADEFQPNMLVVDMEKFASERPEGWFSVDEKEPVAYAKVEVVEASDMKPSDLNGFADPYVKGQLGSYSFRTKVQKKTLNPKWQEEFKIPIISWEIQNMLALEVRDKDHFVDDILGDCSVNMNDIRGGQRHDMWLPLQNVKMGRLRLAVTILEENVKVDQSRPDSDSFNAEEKRESFAAEITNKGSFSSASSEKSPRVADRFEPIDVEGQKETGIWVHRPGSEVSQTWEPRKGKTRRLDTQIRESNVISSSTASRSRSNNSSSTDENPDENRPMGSVRRGLQKIGSVFHRSPKENQSGSFTDPVPSPHPDNKPTNGKGFGVKFVVEDHDELAADRIQKEEDSSTGDSGRESPVKGNMKDKAKSFFKHAEKSARSLRHALSRKGSKRSMDSSAATEQALSENDDSSDDESLPPIRIESPNFRVDESSSLGHVVLQTGQLNNTIDTTSLNNKASPQSSEALPDMVDSSVSKNDVASPKSKHDDGVDSEEQTK